MTPSNIQWIISGSLYQTSWKNSLVYKSLNRWLVVTTTDLINRFNPINMQVRMVHCIYWGVTGYNFQIVLNFFLWRSFLSKQAVQILMKCCIMQHFIWVFTVCQSTRSSKDLINKLNSKIKFKKRLLNVKNSKYLLVLAIDIGVSGVSEVFDTILGCLCILCPSWLAISDLVTTSLLLSTDSSSFVSPAKTSDFRSSFVSSLSLVFSSAIVFASSVSSVKNKVEQFCKNSVLQS